ncbi:MAG: isoprenylcysteine carboxylmethyltransferase family protein, partial [Candidatus Omnitrophica bacterium]|nr:isoprenylcysteine carboxylmethyltransferase family protein [Candidatus Omnitrophota bacterium]
MKQRIKINAIAIAVSLFIVSLFPRFIIRQSNGTADEIMKMVGLSLILLGQLVRVSARGYKAAHSRNGSHLIEDGPYGMVRHPMYAGIILIGMGVVLSVCNVWVFLLFVCMFLLRYLFLFQKEEQGLIRVFGDQYRAYQKR